MFHNKVFVWRDFGYTERQYYSHTDPENDGDIDNKDPRDWDSCLNGPGWDIHIPYIQSLIEEGRLTRAEAREGLRNPYKVFSA